MEIGDSVDEGLVLAEGLVNSHLPSGEHVDIDSPRGLATLLEAHGVPIDRPPSNRDLEEVQRLRARIRAVFEARDPDEAANIVNELLEQAGAHPRVARREAAGWHIEYVPAPASLAGRLAARTGMALAAAMASDGFSRLRVCAWETCRDVFVDRSRNRSRRFCSPQVCGNRAAVAAWRTRQRAATKSST